MHLVGSNMEEVAEIIDLIKSICISRFLFLFIYLYIQCLSHLLFRYLFPSRTAYSFVIILLVELHHLRNHPLYVDGWQQH